MGPRLTIGIPTLDRADLLSRAIASATAQTMPCRVVVADQGETIATARLMDQYKSHPMVRHLPTKGRATCLWENWIAAIEACDTEFFAWLQDDDVVAPHFVERATRAFDAFPAAHVYTACLAISTTAGMGNWWQRTGPMVPMDMIHGIPVLAHAGLMQVTAPFTSMALSPGVAVRWSLDAVQAARNVPTGMDLFAERVILSELAKLGPGVCDPAVVGYWIHHQDNESRKQNRAGDPDGQYRRMIEHIAPAITAHADWKDVLRGWLLLVNQPETVNAWYRGTSKHEGVSPVLDEARAVLGEYLGRVEPDKEDVHHAPPKPEPEKATARKPRRAERAVARN
jgi:glycosyltransferase involved in cell wall biosynthesis